MKYSMLNKIGLLLLLLSLTACGFQLRGQVGLPSNLQKVYIQADNAEAMAKYVSQLFVDQNISVVDEIEKSQVVLHLSNEAIARRVLSVSASSGKQEEVELNHRIYLEIKDKLGEVLLEKQHISLLRDFTFDATAVLAKGAEEKILYQELQQAVGAQILRSLTSVMVRRQQ